MKVLIVEDHPLTARATRQIVLEIVPQATVMTATTMAEAEQLIGAAGAPDHVLLDLLLPHNGGLSALQQMLDLAPGALVTVISGLDDDEIVRACWQKGAAGFVRKGDPERVQIAALKQILVDRLSYFPVQCLRRGSLPLPRLTPAEEQVLDLLVTTQRENRHIAGALGVEVATVKSHVSKLMRKLGARNRAELIVRATKLGVVLPQRRVAWTQRNANPAATAVEKQ